jgi:hypothetical protein
MWKVNNMDYQQTDRNMEMWSREEKNEKVKFSRFCKIDFLKKITAHENVPFITPATPPGKWGSSRICCILLVHGVTDSK